MLLSLIRYAKSRDVLVLVSSCAGTGISKVLKRPRLADKLVVKFYDRKVRRHVLFKEVKKIKSLKN